MAAFDDTQSGVGDITDETRARYEQLKSREQSGELDDSAREDLNQLRSHFEGVNSTNQGE